VQVQGTEAVLQQAHNCAPQQACAHHSLSIKKQADSLAPLQPSAQLRLLGIASCPSLQQLLAAVTLPGAHFTHLHASGRLQAPGSVHPSETGGMRLSVQGCATQLASVQRLKLERFAAVSLAAASLPALHSLELEDCRSVQVAAEGGNGGNGEDGGSFPALRSLSIAAETARHVPLPEALLRRAPRLSAVAITTWGESLQDLTSLNFAPGLTRLSIRSTFPSLFGDLGDLPAGPYLARLHVLDMSHCGLLQVPPALAGATSLRVLDLRHNCDLVITPADVMGTLRHLRQLLLPRWCPSVEGLDDATIGTDAAFRLIRALPLLQPPASWLGKND